MTETELEIVVKESRVLRKRTREIYVSAVQSFLDFTGRNARDWTRPAVERWVAALSKGDVKAQTVNLQLRGLRFAARQRARRFKTVDFTLRVPSLRSDPPNKRRGLTVVEARQLVAACDGDRPIDLRDRAIIVLGLRTGMRRAHMAGVSFEDLDGKKLTVTVKNDRRTVFALDAETRAALAAWTTWLKDRGVTTGPIFRSVARPRISGEVSIRDGLSEHGIQFVVQDRARRARLKNVYPHAVLRTTFEAWTRDEPALPTLV